MKKIPIGKILLDAEKLLDEVIDTHDIQLGDILYWIYGHIKIHRPDCIEEYVEDNSNPEFYYGVPRK